MSNVAPPPADAFPESADSTDSIPSASTLTDLSASLPGVVTLPGDPGWDAARTPWNLSVDQRPAAVAVPRDVDDVQEIIAFAAASGLQVAVQVAGHGASGSLEGSILVRLSAFTEIEVDAEAKTVRVGAGVKWGEVLPHLDGTGLIAMAGSNPNVSVCGYLLGGGHSWFTRRHGIAAHSIRAVDIIDASGDFHHIDASNHPELLWALRGGTGDVGVITALELDLYDAPELYGGKLLFHGSLAKRLLTTTAEVARNSGPDLSLSAGVLRMPAIEQVPPPLRGLVVTYVDAVFVGPAAEGADLLAPFLDIGEPMMNTLAPFTIGALSAVSAEPVEPAASRGWAGFAPEASEALIDGMIELVGPTGGEGATFAQLRVLGGALQTGDWSGGVAGGVDEDFIVYALWEGGEEAGPIDATPISRHATDRAFATFLMPGDTLARAYPAAALARLAAVTAAADPTNLFRGNRS